MFNFVQCLFTVIHKRLIINTGLIKFNLEFLKIKDRLLSIDFLQINHEYYFLGMFQEDIAVFSLVLFFETMIVINQNLCVKLFKIGVQNIIIIKLIL